MNFLTMMHPDEFVKKLQDLCPYPLTIKIHENRSIYAAAKQNKNGSVSLSIHRLFLYSSTPVLEALIRFSLKRDSQAKAVIRQMAHLYFTEIAPPIPDPTLSQPVGSEVDLQVIYDQTNQTYFDHAVKVPIAWQKTPRYRRFRHITYGSYDRTVPLIRINKLLDQRSVPLPFIEFIVYHEMLHTVCAPEMDARGRLKVHTAEFRRKEALHLHFAFAKEWEKKSLKFFRQGSHVRT